jgi:phosphotriesterase-related protein
MHDVDLMSAEVAKVKDAGIACIVDAGHPDSGRDVEFLRQVSMKSGVPVVVGGGFYTQPWYPKEIATMSEDQILNALIKQADDDVLGAFGEVGSWDEITKDERKVFRAVGRAHVATNIPIFTHTGIPGKSALEQLDILEDAGVNPNRVVIGHLGNLVDTNVYVHKTICRRGAYVGFDRQGITTRSRYRW